MPEQPVVVLGDEVRLQQVVWNLLSNAAKFTPVGGRVDVELSADPEIVRLTVRDTGIGIEPDFIPHVFERFRQADARPSREYGGVGLGLAIVRQLVELHGGNVSVQSEGRGAGTLFRVELPRLTVQSPIAAAERADVSSPPNGELTGVRILLVDDEPDALELTRTFVERHGAQASVVTTGERALRELERLRPHVIISDIAMPVMDGFALMRRIRERGHSVRAIAITAYARPEDRQHIFTAGYRAQHLRALVGERRWSPEPRTGPARVQCGVEPPDQIARL